MQHSIRFATGLLLAALLASCGGERTARTFRPPSGGCTTGSLLPCQCPDGRDGLATCNGERYGSCVCDGAGVDGGPVVDTGVAGQDANVPGRDAGGFDAQPPRDGGFADSGTPDLGIWPDASVPDLGIWPDASVPDLGIWPDASVPDSGGPPATCVSDGDCGAPLYVCEMNLCVPGCFSQDPNALVCPNGDCNPLTGRCGGPLICFTDTDCTPPTTVCELPLCLPGCGEPGGATCPAGTTCDSVVTGRCL